MIIQRLRAHLKENGRASLFDMAAKLGTSPEALRNMVAVLEKKGQVRRLPQGTLCGGGCTSCAPETIELYEWVGEEAH